MADSYIGVQEPASPTKKIASSNVVRGADTIEREENIVADPAVAAAIARVRNAAPTADDYALVTREAGGTLVDGTLAATTVAAVLGTQACSAVFIQADPDNVPDCFVGDATNQRFQLVPGQGIVLPVKNVNQVRGRMASSTGNINWLAIT